ncbi:MAG TPA: excinuclease ABC subunit C [Elusimicrobia bacterium]|jgi:putative endonuclease|nr:excinuclease ABC subunit C [Elusimicrobiota bacterium]
MKKQYYVYIATNKRNTVLYTGITNDLRRRMHEHKNKMVEGFTKKYNVNKLVYFEMFNIPEEAISAEKKIKGWLRKKKIDLIKSKNPEFNDLYDEILR